MTTSAEYELEMQSKTDTELAELAGLNDMPRALKARGEIARRQSRVSREAIWTGRVGIILAVVAIIIAIVALLE